MHSTLDEASGHVVPPSSGQSLFEAEHLPFPPVPLHLASLLRPDGSNVFSTRPLQETPYNLSHFLDEFEADPELPPYAVVGFDGHGFNSWAAHYYLVNDGLALFIQLPWGGAYLDPEPARAEIAELFDWAALLQSKMALASQLQVLPAGQRLQVVASRFSHAGWRWVEAGAGNKPAPWNAASGMKAAIQQALDKLLDGKRTL